MTTRSILTPYEFECRLAAFEPRILLVESMPLSRIVHERATELDYGPQMRRMDVYAMSPKTFGIARDYVLNQFGVEPSQSFSIDRVGPVLNHRFRIPLAMSALGGGQEWKEWEVELL